MMNGALSSPQSDNRKGKMLTLCKSRRGALASLCCILFLIFREFFIPAFDGGTATGPEMNPRGLCEIGGISWSHDDIRAELKPFREAYDSRPIQSSRSGSNLFHAFAQWCLIRMLTSIHSRVGGDAWLGYLHAAQGGGFGSAHCGRITGQP